MEVQEHLMGIHNLNQSDLIQVARQQIAENHYLWSHQGELIMEATIANQEQAIFQLPEMVTITLEEAELTHCPDELRVPENELDFIPNDINESVLRDWVREQGEEPDIDDSVGDEYNYYANYSDYLLHENPTIFE